MTVGWPAQVQQVGGSHVDAERSQAKSSSPNDGAGAAVAWPARSLRERLAVLRRVRRAVAREARSLALAVGAANRSLAEVLASEVLPLADAIRLLERGAAGMLRAKRWGGRWRPAWLVGARLEVRREPLGRVLVIGPGNYPLLLPGVATVQGLAAGNEVLIKPAPGCSAVVETFARLAYAAGVPSEALRVLPESVDAVREALDAGTDKVFLTGSAQTGVAVLRELAPRLVPATLELSGCDAVFVCPDADVELAARAVAFAVTFNGGATCVAPRRVFVARDRADEFGERVSACLAGRGPAELPAGSARRVAECVEDALQAGARLIAGAPPTPAGGPCAAIVLTGVTPAMAAAAADVMAPLVSILPVDDMGEALRLNALCPYALGSAVFGSARVARELAGRINAGVVVVNDAVLPHADPRLPFAGRGRSGFGVTRGIEGLLEMTRPKAISLRSGKFRPHFDLPRAGDEDMFLSYIAAAHAPGVLARLAGGVRTIKALSRARKR